MHFITELPNSPSYYSYVEESRLDPLPEKKSKEKFLNVKEDKRYNQGKIERCKTIESSEEDSDENEDYSEDRKGISNFLNFFKKMCGENNLPFEKSNTFIPYHISEIMENLIAPKNIESVNIEKTNIGNISRNNELATSLKSELTKPSETTIFDGSNDKDANIKL